MYKKILFFSRSRYFPRKLQRNHIVREAADKHYDVIIDVGGGRSKYKKILKCNSYISTDIEDRIGDGAVVIADANVTLPFNDATANLVICTEVLEHLHSPLNAVEEMARILKPGGKIVLTVPFLWPEHEAPVDFYRYTQWGVTHLLTTAGFEDITLTNTNGFWTSWVCLLVSKMRSPLLAPLVFLLNLFILLLYRFESKTLMPLGVHVTAFKPKN